MSIVILAGRCDTTWIVANALKKEFEIKALILEAGLSKSYLAKRRIKNLGLFKVLGQMLFMLYAKLLGKKSLARIEEIKQKYHLNCAIPNDLNIIEVDSVNSKKTINILQSLSPSVIVINGTRILSTEILKSVQAPFINTHCGITPKYRGVHGAYWAYANQDDTNAGVTIHLVDAGIDTGGIISQAKINREAHDNYCTYPYLQMAAATPMLIQAVEMGLNGSITTQASNLPSKLYYHPTLWFYWATKIKHGVK